MRFYVESITGKMLYTEKLLQHLVRAKGHELGLERDSVVLASVCDVTDLPALERIRDRHPSLPLISGGHFAKIGYRVMGLHSDAVWLGHVFELLDCSSLEEAMATTACYVPGETKHLRPSKRIEWRLCPAIQIDKRRYYLWGGTGCKGKCSFCYTSWSEEHRERPGLDKLVARTQSRLGSAGTLKVISNAYSTDLGDDLVQDMMLRDLLRVRSNSKRKLIRCGVEFATEASRKRHAKPIKTEEIRAAIRHAERLGLDLQLFLIGGWDTRGDWEQFIHQAIPESDALKPRVFLKWTNLEYQQLTPLWRHAAQLDPERYLDSSFTDWAFRVAAHKNKRIRVLQVKYPAHAIWRMCMSNVRDMGEYRDAKRHRNVKDMGRILELADRIRPWEHELSELEEV